ncbi:putative membrane protein [Geobacillus sp. PA-3]|uniref:YesL family protein n=1 Tax=Geobacillus sp. PA-3 TaxID=1699078 RepID=UPI0006E533B2|nr:YesL family protein [Geobacillus sp. PA-3]KQB94496.1 putative membrane protein [Geobacillus sp. PA-3]
MEISGFSGGLYRLMDWISKMALLNILWIVFTALGLFVFGFFPATIAMFAVVRKWIYVGDDVPAVKVFWSSYKREFLKSNLLGLAVFAIGGVLYIDFLFVRHALTGPISLLYAPLMILMLIFLFMLFYIPPIFVHYDMKISQVIKSSFFVMIMNPLSTVCMAVGAFGICFILSYAPPIAILFSGNLIALITMKFASKSFEKVDRKSQLLLQK